MELFKMCSWFSFFMTNKTKLIAKKHLDNTLIISGNERPYVNTDKTSYINIITLKCNFLGFGDCSNVHWSREPIKNALYLFHFNSVAGTFSHCLLVTHSVDNSFLPIGYWLIILLRVKYFRITKMQIWIKIDYNYFI